MSIAPLPAVDTVDIFSLAQARRVAAMLDLDHGALNDGDPIPEGWHFALLAGETARRTLRSDGFPGLGVPLAQMGRERLLLGQRETSFHAPLFVGAPVRRQSAIEDVTQKVGRNGPLSIVKIRHELSDARSHSDERAAIVETQTYYLADLPPKGSGSGETLSKRGAPPVSSPSTGKVITPDDIMLFQYSALGFNTHRIHFDRDYATRVEHHPDLVVNGGLATLLATEYVRTDLGLRLKSLSARHLAPLYVNKPMTISAPDITNGGATISLLDGDGAVAAELVMTFHEI